MTPDLPIIISLQPKKKKLASNKIHAWAIFSIYFIATLVVVSSIKAYLPLLVSALAMVFIWSQMTKPIDEIGNKSTNDDSNQLNLFHRQYRYNKKYYKVKKELQKQEDSKVA